MNIGHKLLYSPQPKDGPVLVAIEFQLDRSRGSKFVEMMVPSWTQYLLQQDRMTKTDREVIEQAESLHIGAKAPEVRMYLGVNKELLSFKQKSQAG